MHYRYAARWSVILGVVLLGAPVRAEEAKSGPFSDLPVTHWSYDAIQKLAQGGMFTGYPDGTFAGKRTLTRYEFAVAVQRMVQDVQAGRAQGLTLSRPFRSPLSQLTEEFAPELAMLGADLTVLRRNLLVLSSPWRGDAPDLAQCGPLIYPGVGNPKDPEYSRGYWLAVQEWQRGEVVFYVAMASASPRISASTGVLYRTLDTRADEPGKFSLIAGHNAEVKRRLERYGAPAGAHPDWVQRAQSPEGPWQAGPPQACLDVTQREAASRNAEILVCLEEQGRGRPPLLRVTTSEGTRELPLPGLELSRDTLEVCWSPQFDLLHLAQRVPGQERVRIRVVELRHGETLHEVEVAATSLRPPPRSGVQNVYPLIDPPQ